MIFKHSYTTNNLSLTKEILFPRCLEHRDSETSVKFFKFTKKYPFLEHSFKYEMLHKNLTDNYTYKRSESIDTNNNTRQETKMDNNILCKTVITAFKPIQTKQLQTIKKKVFIEYLFLEKGIRKNYCNRAD